MRRTMLDRVRKLRQDEGGFTLIELLIVIVILGVLSAIVAFSVQGITDRGKVSACKAEVKTVGTAQEAFYAKTGGYPTALADLAAAPDKFLRSATTVYVTGLTATGGLTTDGTCPAA